ncbi:MAG: hypothetical protein ACLSDV_01190, partial [Bifidobacterium longum]
LQIIGHELLQSNNRGAVHYLRFEGRILTVPEVYFRFKGLVILHTTSIRSITPTPFRRFYALSTWVTAP